MQELDAVIDEVRRAKKVRFSASAMIDKENLLQRLEQLRAKAPAELQKAGTVVKDHEALLERARNQAEELIAQAELERERMLEKSEVVKSAHRKAGRIIEDAKQRAHELQIGADDYADSRLASFEVVLQKTLAVVNRGREALKGRIEPGDELDEELSVQPASVKTSRR